MQSGYQGQPTESALTTSTANQYLPSLTIESPNPTPASATLPANSSEPGGSNFLKTAANLVTDISQLSNEWQALDSGTLANLPNAGAENTSAPGNSTISSGNQFFADLGAADMQMLDMGLATQAGNTSELNTGFQQVQQYLAKMQNDLGGIFSGMAGSTTGDIGSGQGANTGSDTSSGQSANTGGDTGSGQGANSGGDTSSGQGANTGGGTGSNNGSTAGDTGGTGSNNGGTAGNTGAVQGELGFYGGAGNPALAEQTSATLGRSVAVTDYFDMTQPENQTAPWVTSQYAAWQAANPNTPIILGVPLTFQNQSLQQTASGANNQEFVDLAQQLVNSGMGNATIRLGWEMNGTWYPWGNDPTDYVNAYNNAAEAMKSVPGANFSFDWNVSAENPGSHPFQDYYPGNQNVNSIGIDSYDFDYSNPNASPQERWNTILNGSGGLQDVENFAQQQGKPFAVPEWGLWFSGSNAGGGDDPYYINQMAQFLKSAPNLDFQSYYGDGTTTPSLAQSPESQAAYNQDFSGQS
jgi:hypothetical protein